MRVFILKKATLIRVAVFVLILAGAIVYSQAVLTEDAPVYNTESAYMPICASETDQKKVALTFDTTFGADQTQAILDVLKQYNAKATFAVMGIWAGHNADILEQVVNAGHQLMSHSMAHERYPEMENQAMLNDAGAIRALLLTEYGVDTPYIRPPYGACDDATVAALRQAGYVPVRWSVDARDWDDIDAQTIVSNVIDNIDSGDIVVFQNNVPATVEALPQILALLEERGYQCVGISDLIVADGYTVDAAGVQRVA